MAHFRSWIPLLLVASLLAGCAPGAVGSRGTPIDLRRADPAQVAPGGAVYAQLLVPASDLGLGADAFTGLFVPCGGDATCAVVTTRFELVDAAVPEGWRWRVDRADAIRRPRFPTQVDVRLRLDVPVDARLGGTQVRGRLVARDGRSLPVALVVQVVR